MSKSVRDEFNEWLAPELAVLLGHNVVQRMLAAYIAGRESLSIQQEADAKEIDRLKDELRQSYQRQTYFDRAVDERIHRMGPLQVVAKHPDGYTLAINVLSASFPYVEIELPITAMATPTDSEDKTSA